VAFLPHASWPIIVALMLSLLPSRDATAPAFPRHVTARTTLQREDGCGPGAPDDPGTGYGLIGHATTDFPTSAPDRNFNMALASRRLCGTWIPAGGVFSFNGSLGQASRAAGYREGRVFIGDRIVAGYGGGICQVASTIYNAATRAGLPIEERHQHGLTVPYLFPGEDATISYGYLDLRIRNDTGGPVRLLTRATGGRVTAEFFGPREPPETEWLHKVLRRYPFYTIRNFDPELPPGGEAVDAAGQEGFLVHAWLRRSWPDGRQETLDKGVDSYRPSPRILRVGRAKA
jgi:hypothetical protein